MTNDTRRALGEHQRAQRPYFLFGAKEASVGEEYRGIRKRLLYWCNETKTGGRQGRGPRGDQDGVTLELFTGEDRFCQDSLY